MSIMRMNKANAEDVSFSPALGPVDSSYRLKAHYS